jgi:hypothetical protein
VRGFVVQERVWERAWENRREEERRVVALERVLDSGLEHGPLGSSEFRDCLKRNAQLDRDEAADLVAGNRLVPGEHRIESARLDVVAVIDSTLAEGLPEIQIDRAVGRLAAENDDDRAATRS